MMIANQHNVRDQAAEGEPALKHTAQEVQEARRAIRALMEDDDRDDRGREWTFSEIQDSIADWSDTLVSLALLRMLEDGELDLAGKLKVRLSHARI